MASQQAGQKVVLEQMVAPIDLQYNNQGAIGGANWDLPSQDHPTAKLISASTIDVTGKVPGINADRLATVSVSFQLGFVSGSRGWQDSNIQYGYKLTEDGEYRYDSAQGGITNPPSDKHPCWVEIIFIVDQDHLGPTDYQNVYFQLKEDTTEDLKSGMVIHQAKVKQTGFNN